MRPSSIATALCLSLIHTSNARAHGRSVQLNDRNDLLVSEAKAPEGLLSWLRRLFRRNDEIERRQDNGICVEDDYYEFVYNSSFGQAFCQSYLSYDNTTQTVDYTPTSTYIDTFTTSVTTRSHVVRTTPVTTVTVTVTAGMKAKRDPQITARAELSQAQVADFFALFRRQNAASSSNSSDDDAAMSSAFSSACSCQSYGGLTVTETYTDEPAIVTLSAYGVSTTTVVTIRIARPLTSTVTVDVVGATSSPPVILGTAPVPSTTFSSSLSAPTPTAPAFTCPDDNNTTVTQMVNDERFDYTILCDTDLTDADFYGALYYSSFGACVAACSTNDYNFSSPVCQGVSYYNTANEDGYNCFLKTGSNGTVPAVGVDSALLREILLGVTNSSTEGTSTESAPFVTATPTENASQLSSIVSAMMGNSTTDMTIITPGPQIPVSGMLANAATAYSTYITNGTTLSFGTAYSTYYTGSDGSWFYSSYTSFSQQWASSTTIYAESAQSTELSSSDTSTYSDQSGDNGDYNEIETSNSTTYYPGGYNVTEVISNSTYNANGSEIASSATTNYYSYQTSAGDSGSGNETSASGGNSTSEAGSGESGAGNVTSSAVPITSTSFFSTQTVIVNTGGTAGASGYAASGAVNSPTPSTSATTIVDIYGTAYSSGFGASGVLSSLTPSTSATTIIDTYGTAYSSGFAASGALTGTAGASGYAGSGGIVSPTPSTSTTIIINTAGTAYSSGFVASGVISGTAGSSGTVLSGVVPSSGSPMYSYTDTDNPRIGGYPSSSAPLSTAPTSPSISTTLTAGGYSPPPGYRPSLLMPTGTAPSSGYPASSPPNMTAPAPYPSATAPVPYVNTAPPYQPASSGSPVSSTNSTVPAPTAPSYPFTDTNAPRSGYPAPTGYPSPTGTAPISSGSPIPSVNSTVPAPTAPGYPFSDTGVPRSGYPIPTGYPMSTGTTPVSSGSPIPSMNSTVSTPTTPGYPFSDTGVPRSGYPIPTGYPMPTGTMPASYSPFPTAPASTCGNMTAGTITIFVTTTEYGCYANCAAPGGYGGPESFGPPVFAHPTAA